VPVLSRDSLIKTWIRSGTTITSDCWCASEGFQHQRVITQNFVDPDSGAHTQHIERLWRDVRGGIPRFGRCQKHVVGYLAEFLFKGAPLCHMCLLRRKKIIIGCVAVATMK